jgi:ClpP class serine protease
MNRFSLFHEILSSVWFLDERSKIAATPLLVSILKGGLSFEETKESVKERNEKSNLFYHSVSTHNIEQIGATFENGQIQSDSELIVDLALSGVMTKNDGMSSRGTDSLRNDIAMIGQSPNISALRFKVNSGGGSAFSCEGLCQDLMNFEARYNKPVMAYIDGQADSAAYYAISNIKDIVISGEATESGSIGTMSTLYNDAQMLENEGIKEIIVRATKSTNKNEAYYRALNGDTEMLQKEVLDPLQRGFEQYVRQGRKKIKANSEALTGKTYYGSDIIEMGLADYKMDNFESLDYLMRRAKKMKRKI